MFENCPSNPSDVGSFIAILQNTPRPCPKPRTHQRNNEKRERNGRETPIDTYIFCGSVQNKTFHEIMCETKPLSSAGTSTRRSALLQEGAAGDHAEASRGSIMKSRNNEIETVTVNKQNIFCETRKEFRRFLG